MTKELKGILFDFNGTLFFDSDLHMEAFRQVFPLYGLPVPTDDFMADRCFGRTNETIFKENINPNATKADIDEFELRKESVYHKLCLDLPERFRLVDGAEELLDELKARGIPFCLATGSNLLNLNFYIKHMKLDRWFTSENTVYDDGTYPGKPAPDIYRLAAGKLSLDPSDCLVFEDGTSGIISARRAGAGAVIGVYEPTMPSPITDDVKCDEIYHDFTQWKEILKNLGF